MSDQVFRTMLDYYKLKGEIPSTRQIADQLKLQLNQVYEALTSLRKQGKIRRRLRGPGWILLRGK